MNYIILLATGTVIKTKIQPIKIAISSLIGGSYAILSYMTILEAYSNVVLKFLLSVAMVYVAFLPKNLKSLLKELMLFYLTSFTFGGVAFALLYFVKPQDILMKNGVYIGTYPIKIALLGGIVGFILLNIVFKTIKGKLSKKDMLCDIEIHINGKIKQMKAILDTGNLLKEPITGSPVVVVEQQELEELIPHVVLKNIEKIIRGEIQEIGEKEYASKFRIIPFSSLGKENGLILGIKADSIKLNMQEEEIKTNAIIGIYPKSLTKNGCYHALIGLEILEGGKKNEYHGIAKM